MAVRPRPIDEYFQRTDSVGPRNFLTDMLGSTLALTDTTGNLQTQYSYDPFGSATASGHASSNPLRFTGRENDGTAPDFYRARYYSPTFQRFVAQDPLDLTLGNLNLYAYGLNDLLDEVDPTGLVSLLKCAQAYREARQLAVASKQCHQEEDRCHWEPDSLVGFCGKYGGGGDPEIALFNSACQAVGDPGCAKFLSNAAACGFPFPFPPVSSHDGSSSRAKCVAAVGIGLLGVLVGALMSYWLTLRFSQTEALAAVIRAKKSESTSKENEMIIILSQAIAKDPDYYEPFNLLGDVLARRDDRDLALSDCVGSQGKGLGSRGSDCVGSQVIGAHGELQGVRFLSRAFKDDYELAPKSTCVCPGSWRNGTNISRCRWRRSCTWSFTIVIPPPYPYSSRNRSKDPLGGMLLLGRLTLIFLQDPVNDLEERIQLRPRRRPAPPVSWRHRER